jgi:integrase
MRGNADVASIRKRTTPSGHNRWQVRLEIKTEEGRIQRARNFDSFAAAKAWAYGEGRRIEQQAVRSEGTVAAFFEKWLAWLEEAGQLERKTLIEYRWRLAVLAALVGDKPLGKLTAADLDRSYARLLRSGNRMGGPLHPRTVASIHRIVVLALERGRRWRLLGENPGRDCAPPTPGRSLMRAPNAEELTRYLDATKGTPYWPFAIGALTTGLRRAELCGLRWSDVDLEHGTLQVAQVIAEAGGDYWIRPKPKTPAGFRQVAMPPVLIEELSRLRLQQAEEKLSFGPHFRRDLDLCLPMPGSGGEPWRPNLVTRGLSRIARKIGLPRTVAPLHGLRHKMASAMIASVPLKVVSVRLGHANVQTTANLYMHTDADHDRAAAAVIEGLVRPLVTKQEP